MALQLYELILVELLLETEHINMKYSAPVFAEEGLMYRARYFGDSELYQRAQRMGTPSCSRLSEIQVILDG